MSASTLRMTIAYEQGEDGWVVASVPEVPGTRVIDALKTMLTPDDDLAGGDTEPLVLTVER